MINLTLRVPHQNIHIFRKIEDDGADNTDNTEFEKDLFLILSETILETIVERTTNILKAVPLHKDKIKIIESLAQEERELP